MLEYCTNSVTMLLVKKAIDCCLAEPFLKIKLPASPAQAGNNKCLQQCDCPLEGGLRTNRAYWHRKYDSVDSFWSFEHVNVSFLLVLLLQSKPKERLFLN